MIGTHELVKAGASITVVPMVLSGDWIRVEITPRLSYYDRGRKTLKLQELATTVMVRSGQSIVIGGLDTQENTVGWFLFGGSRDNTTASRIIVLTPRIIDTPTILE